MDFNTGVWGEVSDRDASHPCLAFPPKDIVGNIELKTKTPKPEKLSTKVEEKKKKIIE